MIVPKINYPGLNILDFVGSKRRARNPVIDPFDPPKSRRKPSRRRLNVKKLERISPELKKQLKGLVKDKSSYSGATSVVVLNPDHFIKERALSVALEPLRNPFNLVEIYRRNLGFDKAQEEPLKFSTKPKDIQTIFLENSRVIRQGWRAAAGVKIAVSFPAGTKPTKEQLGILGYTPGFLFGVVLPAIGFFGAMKRFNSILDNPQTSTGEKVSTGLAVADSSIFLGLGVVNYASNHVLKNPQRFPGLSSLTLAKIVDKTGYAIPFFGAGYNMLSGVARMYQGSSHSYISTETNLGLGMTEVASGPLGLVGTLIVGSNPWTGAAFLVASAVLSIGAPLYHEGYSSEGVAIALAEEIDRQVSFGEKDENGYITATPYASIIHQHLKSSHSFKLFNSKTVLKLLALLKENGRINQIDWRENILVHELSVASYSALVRVASSYFGFFNNEEAAALLFFGLHIPNSEIQKTAIELFLEETEGEEEAAWESFIEAYGLDRNQYGSLALFYSSRATPELKSGAISLFQGILSSAKWLNDLSYRSIKSAITLTAERDDEIILLD